MNIMIPTSRPDQRTPILAAMLKDAAINAQPTKYTQIIRPGMYRGTRSLTNSGPKRCNVPKTASGTAKHKLARATILSLFMPRAWAMSFFAAHSPIKKSAMPAQHIATAVPEISKNMARMAGCIDFRVGTRASDSTTRDALRKRQDRESLHGRYHLAMAMIERMFTRCLMSVLVLLGPAAGQQMAVGFGSPNTRDSMSYADAKVSLRSFEEANFVAVADR